MRRRNKRHGEQERMGPAGRCVCPKCGAVFPHQQGVPCQDQKCPECGSKMLRENSYHHRLFQRKRGEQE